MPETEVLETPSVVAETTPTTDSPAAPEGAAPSAPVVETAITEPAASLSARPRGPDGRFIKSDGTQASEAEHAAIEKEAAAPASPPIAATPTPPAPTAVPQGQPFVVRGDGQRIAMPGSTLTEKGDLTVQAEHVPAYRQLIAEGLAHRGSWRTKEQDYQKQITEAGAVQEARAEKYNEASVFLLSHIANKDGTPNVAWLNKLVADPEGTIELLYDRMQILLDRADLKAPRPRETPQVDPAQQQQQLEANAQSALGEEIDDLFELPLSKAVFGTDEDRKDVRDALLDRLPAFCVELEDGSIALDKHKLKAHFDREIKIRQATQRAALDAQKAAEFNARRNQPVVTAPPVVSTKGPGSSSTSGAKTYKDRAEWRKAQGLMG